MKRNVRTLVSVCAFSLAVAAGCNKEVVNFQEKTPEEQFTYAKKFFDKKD